MEVLFAGTYLHALKHARAPLHRLLEALWLDREISIFEKAALSVWSLSVLFAPRMLGRPLARYVSNPASR